MTVPGSSSSSGRGRRRSCSGGAKLPLMVAVTAAAAAMLAAPAASFYAPAALTPSSQHLHSHSPPSATEAAARSRRGVLRGQTSSSSSTSYQTRARCSRTALSAASDGASPATPPGAVSPESLRPPPLSSTSAKSGDAAAPVYASETTREEGVTPSDRWELDVYSRPVKMSDGKKLWELLLCDSMGGFRHMEQIPGNMVNSREVRKIVERVIEQADVKPVIIRFFRNAMFNMINIALSEVDVAVQPSRTTYTLYQWLEDREKNVYPKMEGYAPAMKQASFLDIRTPQKLPDQLKGESYAFVTLPLSEFRNGNINEENVGTGQLCPIDPALPDDTQVHGIVVFTRRSKPLSQWMSGLELAFVKADLKRREVVLECGINTQYLYSMVRDEQKQEAQLFEASKEGTSGYHFLAIQEEPDSDEMAGFWLLKEVNE